MPQINRIRVNNVKYNFGTQYYDDFMMRFNCSNTLYDLANGGGKSLLMLLLMQNVIPNCTLDDKQPIEKLFRQGGGNTVIHSLVEWKLDACFQKDNYKYMTTGFCARKAGSKAGEEDTDADGSTAVAGSASSSIEYFNYCIFYREFGDNDIKNLPLESNGERITYNGLKSYLRDLEKNDFGVSVKIFDAKGEYLNFISKYGLYESQWEIIRGINKTEGHVRTYFENSYKTSRKVVEDLLIEEIIQKSYNNSLGIADDEGAMAQTLIDIKDKLLELSKKHSQINSYDSQMAAIDNFAEYVRGFKALYDKKEMLEDRLYKILVACKAEAAKNASKQAAADAELEERNLKRDEELKLAACGEIAAQEASLKELKAQTEAYTKQIEQSDRQIEEKRHRLTDLESAQDYADYLEYSKSLMQITETLSNRNLGNDEIVAKLQRIAAVMKDVYEEKMSAYSSESDSIKKKIEDIREKLDAADKRYTECVSSQAAADAKASYVKESVEEADRLLAQALEAAGMLVAEGAAEQLRETEDELRAVTEEIQKLELNISDISEKKTAIEKEQIMLTVNNELMRNQLKEADERIAGAKEDEERIERLLGIYNASSREELADVLYGIHEKMGKQLISAGEEKAKLDTFITNARKGTYECHAHERDMLAQYLSQTYGEDVVEGHEWFRQLSAGQKRDVFKRVPFVEYGFIIKNDFDRIKEDVKLLNFQRGAYVVPIISESVLYDTKLEVNTELVAFAMKDMHFLRDDASLNVEIETAEQEAEELDEKLARIKDRRQIVWEDYTYVLGLDILGRASLPVSGDALKADILKNDTQLDRLKLEYEDIKISLGKAEERLGNLTTHKEELSQRKAALDNIAGLAAQIDEKNRLGAQLNKDAAAFRESLQQAKAEQEELSIQYRELSDRAQWLSRETQKLNTDWEELYSKFYVEGVELGTDTADIIELESTFIGLKELIDKENADISDKEALAKHYRASMEKCVKAVTYRGSEFDDIKRRVDSGELVPAASDVMYEIKASIKNALDESAHLRDELAAQNALLNRIEGSIEHGIGKIRETFGEYSPVECDDAEAYVRQHKAEAASIAGQIKKVKASLDGLIKEQKDIYVWNKDLERILSGAGLTFPSAEEVARMAEGSDDAENADANISRYEEIADEYSKHMKLMARKADEYGKQRLALSAMLDGYGAVELAAQIRDFLVMPQSSEQTDEQADRLIETNGYIQLEKERVSKGIEDMERIKDNFENRCIQTCCNLKTDLDRLPKLSTIRMDDEVISIVGLSIPYVPEDSFKERMSAYIDETVDMAESFPTKEERLRYIRNRLTWKRMFSVIVTDMNAIRINLYKRERIKDQSRYLKYEEAVGSTGQSQGIYIQFLIAIINYISSINASAKEAGVIGNTIFIDNPFGAAKDIYIWEPIFTLLKTNHVQLIVPARGATPAITGRFDVNYILGQKLNDGRQQTVVVDYYSKTDVTQMEYTRMEYEQTSMFFEE